MSRIGIISDTHDNLDKVRAAVALFNRLEVDRVVHCGDVVAQFVLVEMSRLEMPLLGVFGNCDGDRTALRQRASEFGFTWGSAPQRFEQSGRRFVVTHEPLSRPPAADFHLHGHTHRSGHTSGSPTVINPGEACGWLTGRASAAVLEVETGTVEVHDL